MVSNYLVENAFLSMAGAFSPAVAVEGIFFGGRICSEVGSQVARARKYSPVPAIDDALCEAKFREDEIYRLRDVFR